jgi:hypothetical protein
MTVEHRRAADPHRVRTALKSVWWLVLLIGLLAVGLATNSKYLPTVLIGAQVLAAFLLARPLAMKVLRNRSPSPVILADWIGDAAMVFVWVALLFIDISQSLGWMHGAIENAAFSIVGLFLVGVLIYRWRGQRRLVLVLTALAVAGQWPWSAAR